MQRVFKAQGRWQRTEKAVAYVRNNETIKQVMGDEDEAWWEEFADMWPGVEIIGFENIEYTEEQLERLGEIQDCEDWTDLEANSYVLTGIKQSKELPEPTAEEVSMQTYLNVEYLVILSEIQSGL